MSVIQTIRDKAAWIIIAAIALALIAFIVQDAFQGGGGMGLFGGSQTTLGKVNGTKIDAVSFEQRYKIAETNYQNANYPIDDRLRQQIRDGIWNEYVEDAVLGKEFDKVGLATLGRDERSDILYGPNPPQQLQQQFTDPKTGVYDAAAAHQAITGLKKNSAQYNSFWGEFMPALEKNRQKEKFIALIGNSAYIPKWLVEKTAAENSQLSSISYVNIPFATVSDSTIKVMDEEVRQYVSENKEIYQQEKARGIEYVLFDAAPTKADSAAVSSALQTVKEEFATIPASDAAAFVVRNNSETPYFDGYVLGSKMKLTNADTLKKLADGAVFGPYLDGNNYVLAKMVGRRTMPDTVKSRHILVKIADQQGAQIRTDSAAKKKIDSIVTAIQQGASFDSMVVKLSDDAGSKETKGEYTFGSTQFGTISKEFAETLFYGNTGDKKTVKVDNSMYSGYHYIEVLSQKNPEIAYKIAYVARPIVASDETINAASGLASQFVGESRDKKAFDENVKKKNLNKFPAMDIKPLESGIPGVGESRELVRWIFNDAKPGQVADHAFQVGDKYLVPVLVQAYEKGDMAAERARPLVEYKIRNRKKTEEIIKKVGNPASLDAVSKATNQPILRADSISFSSPFVPNIGNEPKLIGAAFNKNYQAKVSDPISGEIGVFYIKVENISAAPNPNFDAKQMQEGARQQQKMSGFRVIEALKKSADIIDNRVKFF